MRHTKLTAASTLLRLLCLTLSVAVFAPLFSPLLDGVRAQIGRGAGRGQIVRAGNKLGKNLPDLSQVRSKKETQPAAPTFRGTNSPCSDCGAQTAPSSDAVSAARLDPVNRTGRPAVDLLSGNFNWTKSLVDLPGRNKLDLDLALVYNSLVSTQAAGMNAFDADRGQPAPGFRLGFETVQPRFRDAQTGRFSFLLVNADGSRTELRQVNDSNVYEATDDSLLQLVDNGAAGAMMRRPDGTQLSLRNVGGQLQAVEIKDRNGNFISASYNRRGHLASVTDTVGRQISFDRDAGGKLVSITQREQGRTRRVLATFGYVDMNVAGATVAMLTNVGLPDGTSYKFDYAPNGQATRITHVAADGHALAYDAYNVGPDATRPTELRTWTEGANGDAEAVTRFQYDTGGATGLATLPDGSTRKEFFATAGAERGLVTRVEQRDAAGTLVKSIANEYAANATRVVTSTRETLSTDAQGNRLRSRVEFTAAGLPAVVSDFAGDAAQPSRQTRIEYVADAAYAERHVLNLVKEQTTLDAAGAVVSKVTNTYDAPGGIVGASSPVQHDAASFGAQQLAGRGLLTSVRLTNAKAAGVETRFGYNVTGTVAFVRDAAGRETRVSYADDFGDGKNRNAQAFATSAVHPNGATTKERFDYDTGKPVFTQSAKGEAHTFSYDAAGRMTGRLNHQTGGSLRRVYDASGTLVANFTKVSATTKEFGSYTVADGRGRTRARAFDPLSTAMGYRGVSFERDALGRVKSRTRLTKMTSAWVALESAPVDEAAAARTEPAGTAETVVASVKQLGAKIATGIGGLISAVEPSAHAQDCYDDYYGNSYCDDPYYNDWFYGDEWGYDWYWDWTDFADALFFGYDDYWYSDDWDTLSYLAGLSDREFEIQMQFAGSGYFQYAYGVEWNGHGYSGTLPLWAVDSLRNDPNFADGFLYGFHTDVGRDLMDFRSYSGTFGDGSLQIVVDQNTGRFHTDVDRFNPYQDVVGFFGHTFVEVIPNFFRRIF